MSHGDRVGTAAGWFVKRWRAQRKLTLRGESPTKTVHSTASSFIRRWCIPRMVSRCCRTLWAGSAAARGDWTPGHFIEETVAGIRAQVGPDDRVICGLSGGVDSAVAATLVHRAIGEQLTCIFVDHGLLRAG